MWRIMLITIQAFNLNAEAEFCLIISYLLYFFHVTYMAQHWYTLLCIIVEANFDINILSQNRNHVVKLTTTPKPDPV